MAGKAGLKIEFDPVDRKKIQGLLDRVSKGVSSLDGFFDAAEMHMVDSLTRNFESGGRPKPWAPLSPVTIELKGSAGILQDQGMLKGSVNSQNTERDKLSLKMWAGEKHGLYHQDPDMDPMDQWGVTNKKGMPLRPFILFQPEDVKSIEGILIKYVDDLFK